MYHKAIFKYFLCVMFLIFISISSICKISGNEKKQEDYGVFLSLDSSDLKKISEYKTVIIDAQYFSKKDIEYLKRKGCTVYSYINIGSIEVFRDYYEKYSGLSLGDYENWNEEKWMDVSSYAWQKFLLVKNYQIKILMDFLLIIAMYIISIRQKKSLRVLRLF